MNILAKSDPQITLKEHIDDCLIIFKHLKESFPAIEDICNVNGFDFWNTLYLSIIFHDLGKAHPEFQHILKKESDNWFHQRHELFSLPFIEGLEIDNSTKNHIRLIVAGHHKPYDVLFNQYIKGYKSLQSNDFELGDDDILDYQKEFKKIDWDEVVDFLKKNYQINVNKAGIINPEKIVLPYLNKVKTGKIITGNFTYFQLLLLFGALKHCDHLGSARLEGIENINKDDFNFLIKKKETLKQTNKNFHFHQIECSKTIGNIILTAPTGSGKTESAILWLQKQLSYYGQGRIFYILPFTASINAMFERLSNSENGFGKEKVGMIHGKLSDYLYDYLDDYQYEPNAKKEEIESIKQKFKTIYTPIKVITPFQLLKHLFGLRGFEQGLFECLGGYFIFDEIHAYSPGVFAQIKVLLEYVTRHLSAKVMVMTATMPTYLKHEIESVIHPFLEVHADQSLYNSFDRHKVILNKGLLSNGLDIIISDLKAGKKVLVVCNTVKQSQQVYSILKDHSKKSVLLHSAFTGEDRTKHEKDLKRGEIDAQNPIQLLVGTQAIEVSLDIDYDLIYSEPAPFDALVQRFGRVNRRQLKGICPVIVFHENNPSDRFIYKNEVTQKTLAVLEEIIKADGGIIKESKLQYYIDLVYPSRDQKDQDIFDQTYNLLKNATGQLYPMLHSKNNEEDFYKQFDGIKVLPSSLRERFIECLKNFDFVGAERQKVQIRKKKFAQLRNENDINLFQEKFIFETTKGKLITISYWILTKKYDHAIGLIYDEQEKWNDLDIVI